MLPTTAHLTCFLSGLLSRLRCCQQVGARLLLDCCQSVPNMPVDVQAMGADWIVASAHKMCGPTGIGFLWGRYAIFALCLSCLCDEVVMVGRCTSPAKRCMHATCYKVPGMCRVQRQRLLQ